MGVGGVAGVAVYFPIKIGTGAKVTVGKFGSWVGMWIIVGEGVMVGVMVTVAVSAGVKVTVGGADGAGAFVEGNNPFPKGMPAQACIKIASPIIR
jgi:hypothetical protein